MIEKCGGISSNSSIVKLYNQIIVNNKSKDLLKSPLATSAIYLTGFKDGGQLLSPLQVLLSFVVTPTLYIVIGSFFSKDVKT